MKRVMIGGMMHETNTFNPPVANSYIQSDTPGNASSDLRRFTFKRVRRPIFPLDEI